MGKKFINIFDWGVFIALTILCCDFSSASLSSRAFAAQVLPENIVVRTKIRDKERERIFESGVLDSGATGRLARSKTSRLRRTALFENTTYIQAQRTGENGKAYFYCENGEKCSTEDVAVEYFHNAGFKVMRAEHSFWQGMYLLTFLDELFPEKCYCTNGNDVVFYDLEYYQNNVFEKDLKSKKALLKEVSLVDFINGQIAKHESGAYIRELDEWEFAGYKNPTEYFKSPIVQEFLRRIDNKTFAKVVCRILDDVTNNRVGTPDYVVWNDEKLIFVEVKRKNERLSEAQIEWAEFLLENKVLYKVLRVMPKIKLGAI